MAGLASLQQNSKYSLLQICEHAKVYMDKETQQIVICCLACEQVFMWTRASGVAKELYSGFSLGGTR